MAHKDVYEAIDKTLRDIRSNPKLMGGLILILAGDFRQTLPIVTNGTPADQINACIKHSYIWDHVQSFKLTVNMRARLNNNANAATFSQTLVDIGNGTMPQDNDGKIVLDNSICSLVNSPDQLITKIYPYLNRNFKKMDWLSERCILAPTHVDVDEINYKCLQKIPGNITTYYSKDAAINDDDTVICPPEVLNSFEIPGIPSHVLNLKIGAPIILMRNLHSPNLVNGARLHITELKPNLIIATIMNGPGKGESVAIPRIPLIPLNCPINFKRLQFPVKLAFVITINKAQGQTLTYTGVYLKTECFSQGQLYVALSRASSNENVYVFASDGKTTNIVYKSVL